MTGFIKHIIRPISRDIGGLSVRRALPNLQARAVGPWVFFDHFGPVDFKPGAGIDVRPHPHINLATVTYLFEGEIFHRDSLGHAVLIRAGAVNLMVAGSGITHSERTSDALRASGYRLHGLQLWHGLPEADEETPPAFYHTPADDIPQIEIEGVTIRVLIGEAFGLTSPVKTFSETLYFEANMPAGARISLPKTEEIAVYVVKGEAMVDADKLPINAMSIMGRAGAVLSCDRPARIAVIGGKSLGPRFMEWNFISSRKERIQQAKNDWRAGKFAPVIGDEDEVIPLP